MRSPLYYTVKGWLLLLLRPRFSTKIIAFTTLAMVALALLTNYLSYRAAVEQMTVEFGRKLIAVASTGKLSIDGDVFKTLTDPAQMKSAAYQDIQKQLRRLRKANAHINLRFVYTMAPTEKPGTWRYVVDSEVENSPDFSPLGATEDFSYDARFMTPPHEPFAEHTVRYFPGWGPLLSATAPIRSRTGEVVGILSVDAQVDSLLSATNEFQRRSLQFAALAILLSIFVSLPLAWQVIRPISSLSKAVQAVTFGNFKYKVIIPNKDELGDLAQAFNRMTDGLRERELYKQQFERYVSRQVADKILADPEKAFWDAERRRATILFSDIRGFTAMAERLPPEEVIGRLNEYLSQMIDIVFEHEGTLDKFIGDAIMAIFGAPISLGNDEERAVRAAVAMRDAAQALSRQWEAKNLSPFKIGIAINSGDVVVGNIGSERRLEYSAIGDAVNLAARLENLNKDYKTEIILSEQTLRPVENLVNVRYLDDVAVRGREKTVKIYELISLK